MKKIIALLVMQVSFVHMVTAQTSFDSIYQMRAMSIVFSSIEFSNHYSLLGCTVDYLPDQNGGGYWNETRSLYLSIDKNGNFIDTLQYNYFDSLLLQYIPPLTNFDLFSSALKVDSFVYAFGSKLTINSIGEQQNSARITKLDSLGTLQWDKFISWPNDSSIEPIFYTTRYYHNEQRIVMLCDVFDEYMNYEYPIILELDTTGVVTKSIRILNQGNTFLRGISKDSLGNYYCSGFKWLTYPNAKPVLTKLNSTGNIIWSYSYTNQSNSNRNTAMILTKDEKLISVISQGLASNRFLYHLQKVDLNGNEIWNYVFAYSRQLDNSVLYEMPNTNLVHVGMVRDTIGNPPVGQQITMFDSSGVELWRRTYYSGNYNRLYDLKSTSDGGFIMCGDHGNFIDPISGYGCNHAWVLITDSLGLVTSLSEFESDFMSKVELKNPYPNPARNLVNIETFIPLEFKGAQLHLFDMQSRELKTIELYKGLNTTQISISSYANGNYLLALSVDGLAAGSKMIVKVE